MPLGGERVGIAYVKLIVDGNDLDAQIRNALRGSGGTAETEGENLGERTGDGFEKGFTTKVKKGMKEFDSLATRNDTSTHRWADRLGTLFGRGSRNNFVHGLGSAISGLTRFGSLIGRSVSKGVETLADRLFSLAAGMEEAGGAAARLAPALARVATTISGGAGAAGAGVGLAAALVLLVDGLGAVTSLASSLVGVLTALASTVAFGLTGALTAAGGAAFALGAGLGTVALAIANLSKAQKNALKPIGDEFSRIGDAAAQGFGPALVRNVKGIVAAMKPLESLVQSIGEAMGRVLDGLVKSLNGPAWKNFAATFGTALPKMVEDLGDAFTNLGEVFAGVFAAATPLVQRFTGWLERATGQLSAWVNSTAGQERLTQFFNDAGDAAKSLGDLLGAAGNALFRILDAGNTTGQNIVGQLAGQFRNLSTWLSSEKGQKALRDWFQQAQKVGTQFGRIVTQVIKLIDALDTPVTRFFVRALLFYVENLIRVFRLLAQGILGVQGLSFRLWQAMAHSVQNTIQIVQRLWGAVKDGATAAARWVADKFDTMVDALIDFPDKILGAFQGLGKKIVDAIGTIDLGSLVKGGGGLLGKLAGPLTASGGVFAGAQSRIIGEAGPEAVVPLNRPLNQVDPSVRALSAIAQGLPFAGVSNRAAATGTTNNLYITTATQDARAVALETMNYLAAQGY